MRMLITVPAVLAILAAPAAAGPLDAGWVAAEAQWLAHVDIEALKDSTIGRMLLDEDNTLDIDVEELDEFAAEIGIDPRTDIMSITAYGTSGDIEDDAVLIAVTNSKADDALERAMASDDVRVREIELDGYTMYKISHGDDRLYVHVRRLRRERRLVAIATLRHELVDALEVIDDRAASLSMGKDSILASRPKPGSIMFVAAGDIGGFPKLQPASEILRMATGFAIDIGETEGEVHAEATVAAENEEVAENIAAVMEGMIALARLIGGQDPELRPLRQLVRALDVTSNDNKVAVTFRLDAEELLQGLEQVSDR